MTTLDPTTQAVVAALRGESTATALLGLLKDRANLSGEQLALLQAIMEVSSPPAEPEVAAELIDAEEAERTSASSVRVRSSAERAAEWKRELADLRTVNDTLARALGACAFCWGGDDMCERCAGEGTPGAYPPHPQLFRRLVAPAVQRHRRRVAASNLQR